MITAVFLLPDDDRWSWKVGGLTLLARGWRSAQRSGANRVVVIGSEDHAARVHTAIASDKHLKVSARFVARDGRDEASQLGELDEAKDAPGWVCRVGGLVSPGVFVAPPESGTVAVLMVAGEPTGVTAAAVLASNAEALCAAPDPAGEQVTTEALYASVQTREDLKTARRALLRSLRKPLSRGADGLTAYFVNRPISLAMSKYLVATPLTPNHVTTAALAMGLVGAWFAFQGTWMDLIWGGVLLQLSSIFDGVDGELARMRLTSSRFGEWYDTVCDDFINIAFMGGLGHASALQTGDASYVTLAWCSVGMGVLLASSMYADLIRAGAASHNSYEWGFEAEDGPAPWYQPLVVGFAYIAKRDTYTLLMMLLLCANLPRVAFWIMFGGTTIIVSASYLQRLRGMLR